MNFFRSWNAPHQGAYEEAVNELFRCLDRAEEILSKRRYIAGDVLTEADVRLFPTLVRFDEVLSDIKDYSWGGEGTVAYLKEKHQMWKAISQKDQEL